MSPHDNWKNSIGDSNLVQVGFYLPPDRRKGRVQVSRLHARVSTFAGQVKHLPCRTVISAADICTIVASSCKTTFVSSSAVSSGAPPTTAVSDLPVPGLPICLDACLGNTMQPISRSGPNPRTCWAVSPPHSAPPDFSIPAAGHPHAMDQDRVQFCGPLLTRSLRCTTCAYGAGAFRRGR